LTDAINYVFDAASGFDSYTATITLDAGDHFILFDPTLLNSKTDSFDKDSLNIDLIIQGTDMSSTFVYNKIGAKFSIPVSASLTV
jgi:hypothetical protein